MSEKIMSLWDWLGQLSDPRDSSGRRYSLQSVLALLAAGILNGKTSLRSISKWGRNLSKAQLALLNIRRQSPSQTAMHYLLVRLDSTELENVLRGWLTGTFLEKALPDVLKSPRLKDTATDDYAVLRVLSAYCAVIQTAISRMADDLKNADLTARLDAISELLKRLPAPIPFSPASSS